MFRAPMDFYCKELMLIVLVVIVYFLILLLFSRLTAGKSDNETFFRANRRSPWYMVAFGMVGASISGISFVSVPGMSLQSGMTYLQMCLGFILGYFAIAFVLLPVYYRLHLTTIYTYLRDRLGQRSYKTGASFFLLSKMTGAAVRFYVVCIILQRFVGLIWLYTRKGGIKTLVWTDTFQTFCLLSALVLIIYQVMGHLHFSLTDAFQAIVSDERSRVFVFDDVANRQYFWKQFLSGIFVAVVMTGLDQDMMQKNLTCRTLREAQKDMCTYGFAFVPVNLLFLCLGILLAQLAQRQGVVLPEATDDLLPMYAATGQLGVSVVVFFTIGIVAASFSSADSAMTALLGLLAFGLFTKRKTNDRLVPFVAVASPLVCFVVDYSCSSLFDYHFGYELLMLNGLLTFLGLWLIGARSKG